MTTACALPTMYSRGFQLDEGEDAIGLMESRCVAHDSPVHLREAMAENGYLFLRECLEREESAWGEATYSDAAFSGRPARPRGAVDDGQAEARYQPVFSAGISAEKQSAAAASSLCSAGKPDELVHILPRWRGSAFRFHLAAMHITGPAGTPSHCDIVYMGLRNAPPVHRLGSAGRY